MKAEDWIKVEDRMPEADIDVLGLSKMEDVIRVWYEKGEGWISSEYGVVNDITHWMPLVYPKKD